MPAGLRAEFSTKRRLGAEPQAGELFDSRAEYEVSVTYLGCPPELRQHRHAPTLRIAYVESVNQRLMDKGMDPLFAKWADVRIPETPSPSEKGNIRLPTLGFLKRVKSR